MRQALLGDDLQGIARRAIVIYIAFFALFGALGSQWIVGVEPIILGAPAWLFLTYVFSVVFMVYSIWLVDQFDEYTSGEDTGSFVGGGGE